MNRKLDQLEEIIGQNHYVRPCSEIFAAEQAIMMIQVEWELFVRNLILDSATGRFSNSTGTVFSREYKRIRTREAAANLLTSLPRYKFEPNWYLPKKAARAAVDLDISNAGNVLAELGLSPWPIKDLRHIRNFIAHRSKRSALTLRETGLTDTSSGLNILKTALEYERGGLKRYQVWIQFIKGSASRMTK